MVAPDGRTLFGVAREGSRSPALKSEFAQFILDPSRGVCSDLLS